MARTGLVISGGGSKGAFAVGVVEVLREAGYSFDTIAGTSTGALIAPLVAIDEIDTLVDWYTSVRNKDILRLNWRKLFINAIYDTTPLKKLVTKVISEEGRYEKLMNSPCDVLLCAVCMQTAEITYFSQRSTASGVEVWNDQEQFVRCVLASTNQPAFMDLPTIGGLQYTDGGVREVIPLDILYTQDIQRIFVISNSPAGTSTQERQFSNLFSISLRTLDLMGTEVGKNDLRGILEYNEALEQMAEARDRASEYLSEDEIDYVFGPIDLCDQPKELVVIRPEESLNFDGLKFDPENMRRARLIGQETARRVLNG